MGQQQLLLLVLGIVIVGLAVVVGIQAFGENQKKANADALVNDAIRLASDAQAWVLKPTQFGGGGGSFADFSFDKVGYDVDEDGNYENVNGTFTIDDDQSKTGLTIVGCNDAQKNRVTVEVTGTASQDIETTISNEGCP